MNVAKSYSKITTIPSLSSTKKKVRFCICQFSYIEPNNEQEEVDPSDLYYSEEDYTQMYDEIRGILKLMQTCMPIKEQEQQDGFCSRGLEDRTPHGVEMRLCNHVRAFEAVIREQMRQKEDGVAYDPKAISEIYEHLSAPCQQQAHNVGKQDAINTKKAFLHEFLLTREGRTRKHHQQPSLEHAPLSPHRSTSSCKPRMVGQQLFQPKALEILNQ